jgi:predicted MFS family arabinose efflux permease
VVEGNAKLQASQSVSQLAGPGLGGLLIKLFGPAWVIAINAVGYLSSALALRQIEHREIPPAPEERRPLVTEIREGLAFVLRHKLLRRLIACTGLSNLTGSITNAMFVIYLVEYLHLSPLAIGVIESIAAVGGLVGALVTTRLAKWIGEGPTIIVTALLFCVFSFANPLASYLPAVPTLAVGGLLMSAMVVAYNIATVSFRQRLCPPKLLGRMNASARFLVWGTMPIGSFIGGILGSHIGALNTLWVAAIGGLVSLVPVAYPGLWRLHTLPDHDAADGSSPGEIDPGGTIPTDEDKPTVPQS